MFRTMTRCLINVQTNKDEVYRTYSCSSEDELLMFCDSMMCPVVPPSGQTLHVQALRADSSSGRLFVLRYFPFGIIFLVAGKILDMQDPSTLGKKLGWYGITVLAGLFVHGLILLPLFYFILTRKNPFSYIRGLLQALVIALATSSRSASRRSCCELLDSCWCVQVLILS